MPDRRIFLIAAGTAAALAILPAARAAERKAFSQAAFDKAQKAGRPILVEISAPWCPTCRAQKRILSELETAPAFAKLVIFEVDFDTEKNVLRAFGARTQSTLISFKGGAEVGRSVGDTDADSIRQLLEKAI